MSTDEITGMTVNGTALLRGQQVRVRVGSEDLGTGKVDDFTEDKDIVWVMFGGTTGRRMFLPEDQAEFRVLPPASAH